MKIKTTETSEVKTVKGNATVKASVSEKPVVKGNSFTFSVKDVQETSGFVRLDDKRGENDSGIRGTLYLPKEKFKTLVEKADSVEITITIK